MILKADISFVLLVCLFGKCWKVNYGQAKINCYTTRSLWTLAHFSVKADTQKVEEWTISYRKKGILTQSFIARNWVIRNVRWIQLPYFFCYKAHSVIRRTQTFQTEIPSYKAQPQFSAMFTLTTTTCFPTTLITGIHLCEQKRKRLNIYRSKAKQSYLSTQKALFSKAANTQGLRFCPINKSVVLVAAYWHQCMHW